MQSGINCLETKPGLNIVMPLGATVNRRFNIEVLGHRKWVERKRKQLARGRESKCGCETQKAKANAT